MSQPASLPEVPGRLPDRNTSWLPRAAAVRRAGLEDGSDPHLWPTAARRGEEAASRMALGEPSLGKLMFFIWRNWERHVDHTASKDMGKG